MLEEIDDTSEGVLVAVEGVLAPRSPVYSSVHS